MLSKTDMSNEQKEQIRQAIQKHEPVDKLKSLFDMQKELDSFIESKHAYKMPTTLDEWIVKLTVALESEIDEVRREINWKFWKQDKEIDMEKLHEEIADLWFFLIQLTYRSGLTSDDLFHVYVGKRDENRARQMGRSKDGVDYDYREE